MYIEDIVKKYIEDIVKKKFTKTFLKHNHFNE